ncbi:LPXTG cell wall anchor domain-containing protein [Enterococcus ratti]|uniref:LPXTG cell wall anchor domain-containing protein n=1 Tax=Enterococcus ratti TaxID=150033 RepID=UPI0009000C20|nr:LPXTG cell wall anchor domain-containing protein [Enterococcus ratti]
MKKCFIYFACFSMIGLSINYKSTSIRADEKRSNVTVTIINEELASSQEPENQENQVNTKKESQNKQMKQLPETNSVNLPVYSTSGMLIFLVGIIGLYINRNKKEKTNEKN